MRSRKVLWWPWRTHPFLTPLAIILRTRSGSKYRSVKVKLKPDGLDSRYRRGYFAIDPGTLRDRNPEQGVVEALQERAPDTLGRVGWEQEIQPRSLRRNVCLGATGALR